MRLTYKNFSLLLLTLLCLTLPGNVAAWGGNDCCESNYCNTSYNDCCDPCGSSWFNFGGCCDDSCYYPPLCPCRFSAAIHGGVSPTTWTDGSKSWYTIPGNVGTANPFVRSFSRSGNFDKFYDLPWTVGGELAYNYSCNIQLFVEADYIGADGKRSRVDTETNGIIHRRFNEYRVWGGFLGSRYYFSRAWICNMVAPFVGIKAGVINQKHVEHHARNLNLDLGRHGYFLGTVGPSVGLQIGFDAAIWDCISAYVNFEFVFYRGPKTNQNIVLDPRVSGGISNINIGQVGTTVTYPITVGLRYTF